MKSQATPAKPGKLAHDAAPKPETNQPVPIPETPEEKARAEKFATSMINRGLANLDFSDNTNVQKAINRVQFTIAAQDAFREFAGNIDEKSLLVFLRLMKRAKDDGGLMKAILSMQTDENSRDDREREFLAICRRIYRGDRGCSTPVEEFLVGLVNDYGHHPLTPEEVRESLTTFENDLDDVINHARRYARDYPNLVLAPAASTTPEAAQ